jgi:hypothetical protein
MSIKFTRLGTILAATLIGNLLATEVMAQPEARESELIATQSIPAAFERGYFLHAGDAFEQQSIIGTLNSYFGFSLFAEKQIALDAEAVDTIYQDVLKQQTQSGPRMSSRDLDNPYDTSLSENPDYSRSLNY